MPQTLAPGQQLRTRIAAMHVPQQPPVPPRPAGAHFPQVAQQYPSALSQQQAHTHTQSHHASSHISSQQSYPTQTSGSISQSSAATATHWHAAAADANSHLTPGMKAFLHQVRSSAMFPDGCTDYTERSVAAARSEDHMNHIHRELHALFTSLHAQNKLHSHPWHTLTPVQSPAAAHASTPAAATAAAARAKAAVAAARKRHAPPPQHNTPPSSSNRWGAPSSLMPGGLRDTAALPTALRDTAGAAPLHPRPSRFGAPPTRGSKEATLPAWAASGSAVSTVSAPPAPVGGSKRPREPSGYIPLVTPVAPSSAGRASKGAQQAGNPPRAELKAAAKAEKAAKKAAKAEQRKAAKASAKGVKGGNAASIVSPDIRASRSQISQQAAVASRGQRFKAAHDALRRSAGSNAFSGAIVFNADTDFGADFDLDSVPAVQGVSTDLEKSYFRLNAPPNPAEVRPQSVLEQAMEHVLAQCDHGKAYLWASDQLKAIRQDCVVQRIVNDFTVRMYEAHARLALRHADISEFNQCLTQLLHLYDAGHSGCDTEFAAYRILYAMYAESDTAISRALADLSPEQKEAREVQHARKVQAANSIGNYAGFIQLYASAPNLNADIMDRCLHRVRNAALRAMTRAFRPSLPLRYVQHALGISSQKDAEMLIRHCGGVVQGEGANAVFDTKASVATVKTVRAPEEMVANPMV